ncbi:MAG: DUF4203 domain-containing protein [Chloroflexi bacterium]|nr:DUF4203 domain-containing protein [Chloroflexota bacterium]
MTNDSFFALAIAGMAVLFFGFVLLFSGYRFFMILLPIWGFFFGFGLGAQSVQAVVGDGFLATTASWVVGFVLAVVFGILSYLFFYAAVALVAAGLGYGIGVTLLEAVGINFGPVVWLAGVVVAIVLVTVALLLRVERVVIVVATGLLGAEVIVGTFLLLFGGRPEVEMFQNPVRAVLQQSPWWALVYIVLAVLGISAQLRDARRTEIVAYNRYAELSPAAH